MTELKHTLTLRRDAWFVRFYVWLWEASPLDITFCKLFWGLTLAPLGLVLRYTVMPVIDWLMTKSAARNARYYEDLDREVQDLLRSGPKESAPNRMQAVLSWIANTFTRLRMSPAFNRTVLWGGMLLGVAVTAVLGYLFVSVAPEAWAWLKDNWLEILLVIGGIVLGVAALLVGVALAVWKGDEFSSAMKTGYKAVKSNTCPRVELVEKEAGK